jgi:hypothetical protein
MLVSRPMGGVGAAFLFWSPGRAFPLACFAGARPHPLHTASAQCTGLTLSLKCNTRQVISSIERDARYLSYGVCRIERLMINDQ